MLKKLKLFKCAKVSKQVLKIKPMCKILKFNKVQANVLTDDDVNALIVGVVNIIKNNALKKAELIFNKEINYYKDLLSLNLNKVIKLEKEIKKLKGKQLVNCK